MKFNSKAIGRIHLDFLNPKYNRYCSFEERFESKCMLSNQVRTNVLSETLIIPV